MNIIIRSSDLPVFFTVLVPLWVSGIYVKNTVNSNYFFYIMKDSSFEKKATLLLKTYEYLCQPLWRYFKF